ncbi:MAG: hypothetical protein J4F36_07785 [Nitrosopumilaceae archaeon]|nr:hypothetical protein [Nitrosopumilaceae archaeon]
MTTKNFKVVMFGALIAAMILPFVMMQNAEADAQTASDKRFAQFLQLAEKQDTLSEKIQELEDNPDDQSDEIKRLQDKIANLQKEMDAIQQEEIDAFAITSEEFDALDEEGKAMLADVSNPDSANYVADDTLDYMIDQIDKKVVILVFGPETAEQSDSPYDLQYVKQNSHTIVCDDRVSDCDYSIGGIGIKSGSDHFSLGFSAKVGSDRGFVTANHGVSGVGASVQQYPSRTIGYVADTDNSVNCDCAFVWVNNSDFDTVYKVHDYNGHADSITSYASSAPSVGTWVQMLGLASNQEYGAFTGTGQTTGLWGFTYSSDDMGIAELL